MLYSHNGNAYVDELYLGWLKNVEEYHPSLNIDGTNTPIYVTSLQSSFQSSSSSLPSSFDLRNVNGQNYVTPIRDQANAGTCWAFASIAALESFLLKNEGKSYEFSTKYDFSENNLKNVMSNLGKQGIYTRLPNDGGNDNIALAYFIRWSGPILEEYDKYDLIGRNPVNNVPLEFFNSEKHVQGVKYIHARTGDADNDEIKKAIMDYGGGLATMKLKTIIIIIMVLPMNEVLMESFLTLDMLFALLEGMIIILQRISITQNSISNLKAMVLLL